MIYERSDLPNEDGFHFRGREAIYYVEGERAAEVGGDKGVGGYIIYYDGIRWMPPHENERMTRDKRHEILAKFDKMMADEGMHYIVKNLCN